QVSNEVDIGLDGLQQIWHRQHLREVQALQGILMHHTNSSLGEIGAYVAKRASNTKRGAAEPCRPTLGPERIEHPRHSLLPPRDGEAQIAAVAISFAACTARAPRAPATHPALALFAEHEPPALQALGLTDRCHRSQLLLSAPGQEAPASRAPG